MVHAGDAHSGPDHREGSDREASTQLIDGAAGAEGHLIADLIRTIFVAEAATGIDSHIVAEAHDGFRTHDEGAVGFDYHAGGGGKCRLPPPSTTTLAWMPRKISPSGEQGGSRCALF